MVRVCESCESDPFCNLRSVDARGGCQGNGGGRVNGGFGDMIGTRRNDMYELFVIPRCQLHLAQIP